MIMKQKITFILCLLLIGGLRLNAVEVSTFADFKTAVEAGGDVVVAADLENATLSSITLTKDVNISAKSGRVKMDNVLFSIESDINFSMKGIIAFCSSEEKTPSKILVNIPANVAKVSSLTVEDCEVYDYTICFLKALGETEIPTISVKNTVVHDLNTGNPANAAIMLQKAKVSKATFYNVTFYRCQGGGYYSNDATTPIDFSMEKVSFIDCGDADAGFAGSKDIINFAANASSKYTLKDCLISGSYTNKAFSFKSVRLRATTGKFTITNSLSYKVNVYALANPATELYTMPLTATALTVDYDKKAITTTPATIKGIGSSYFSLNGVITGITRENLTSDFYITDSEVVSKEISDITVYAISGTPVMEQRDVNNLSIASLNKGIYLVKVATKDGKTSIKKFIKK